MKMARVWLVIAVAAVLLISRSYWLFHLKSPHTPSIGQPAVQTSAPSSSSGMEWSHGHDGSLANAEEHWEKHGAEFPEFHSAKDYENGARDFISHPPSGTQIKSRASGDKLYYDPASNTFAVADSDGVPRTFFRPHNGRNYWDRQ